MIKLIVTDDNEKCSTLQWQNVNIDVELAYEVLVILRN